MCAGSCFGQAFPATGQTTCWNSSGNVIACASTGQDGELRKGGALAYVDNADGTVTDVNTGLVWEKLSSSDGSVHDISNAYNWDQAFSGHVATLNSMNFAGHSDWRVPNYKELMSIVNLQNAGPAVSPAFNNNCTNGCTVLTCSCTGGNTWTSTSYANFPTSAWHVHFFDGIMVADGKGGSNFNVRAVRGGS